MESSRFYRDLSVDLRSEPDKSVYFRSWGYYLLYNAIITKKIKHSKNSPVIEKSCRPTFYFVNSSQQLLRMRNLAISPLCRYFLLLNTSCF